MSTSHSHAAPIHESSSPMAREAETPTPRRFLMPNDFPDAWRSCCRPVDMEANEPAMPVSRAQVRARGKGLT